MRVAYFGSYVMSATHSWFARSARKRRFTRSAAGRSRGSRRVVTVESRRLLIRWRPARHIRRAIRLPPTRTPCAATSALTRGWPYVSRESARTCLIHSVSTMSSIARWRDAPVLPVVKAAGGTAQHPTHCSNGEVGLGRADEFEDGVDVLSLLAANQAVVFDKMSRSLGLAAVAGAASRAPHIRLR